MYDVIDNVTNFFTKTFNLIYTQIILKPSMITIDYRGEFRVDLGDLVKSTLNTYSSSQIILRGNLGFITLLCVIHPSCDSS